MQSRGNPSPEYFGDLQLSTSRDYDLRYAACTEIVAYYERRVFLLGTGILALQGESCVERFTANRVDHGSAVTCS